MNKLLDMQQLWDYWKDGSEYFVSGNMIDKLGRTLVGKGLKQEVLNSFGVSVTENFFQEAIMDPLQELSATIFGGEDTADWENIVQRSLESGVDGIISAIILGGASVGIASAENVINKTNPTNNDYNKAIVDTLNSNKVDVKGIIDGANQAIIDNGNTQQFFATTFNNDGNVENVQPVKGKQINNPNKNIKVSPVIIRNNQDNYNIIDKNTGLLLDSEPYTTLIEAQAKFNNKMINLDKASIQNINNKIVQSIIAVDNKIKEIVEKQNVENTINVRKSENTKNTNSNTVSTTNTYNLENRQNEFRNDFNNGTTNYTISNTLESSNNGLHEVAKLMTQISDNSIYNGERTSQAFRVVTNNIPNIEIESNNNGTYLNSLNREGDVVYRQEILNKPYKGWQIKEVVNNAINNADLSNINSDQTNENGFRNVSDNKTSDYMYDNENRNIRQNNKKIKNNNSDIPRTYEQQINNYRQKSEQLNKTNGDVVEINTNIFENISKKKQSSFLNEYLRYEVKGNDYFVDSEKIIANSTTTGKLKNGHTNFDKRIEVNLRNELKANIIGNLDTIINNSKLYQTDKPDIKNRTFADTFDRRKTLVKYNNQNYEVMFEVGKRNNVNTLYGIGNIKRTNKNRLSLPKLTSKKGLQNTNKIVDGSHKSNISITQQSKNVKSNTSVNSNYMQNNENNTKNIQKELHNRVQNAILSKNSRKNTFLGIVSDKVANKIKSLFGIDVSGRKHMLSDYDIRHIIKQHGNPVIEKSKGQIAVTTKDIEKIPDIIENYDSIIKGTPNVDTLTKKQFSTIRYTKNYNENTTYVVEVIPSNNNQLNIKTMWKKPITLTNSQKAPSSTSKTRGNSTSSTKKNNSVGVNHGYHEAKALHYTSETKPNSSYSSKSIPQKKQNVKDDDVRAMRKNTLKETNKKDDGIQAEIISNTTEYDNQGNKLSKEQQDFFKNSNVRDENGKLKVMWHFTNANNNFTVFDMDKSNTISNDTQKRLGIMFFSENVGVFEDVLPNAKMSIDEEGNYFYNGQDISDYIYGFKTDEFVIDNIKFTPFYINGKILYKLNEVQLKSFEKYVKDNYLQYLDKFDIEDIQNGYFEPRETDAFVSWVKLNGFDGFALSENTDGRFENVAIFNSKQAKKIDNKKPTSNPDIRFAKKTAKTIKPEGEILEPGQTNAQRDSSYIEQELRKIEKAGNWDDSIPITKMTDIRKRIEDYLGIGIQKGHFRQQAYGIYKNKRDVIRTKELKDIDTILHETGHALDIGKRINLNKETISEELLKAVNNYGGYEAETRDVQLEEGFAEIIREYTIVPEQARIDYPQTVAILEGIRQTDKDFNKFITDVQQLTYNYIHQNPENRGISNVSIGERTDKTKWTKEYIQQEVMRNIYDKDWALKSAVNEMQKINGKKVEDLRASENAYYLTRLTSGIGDKVVSMLSKGYIDENGIKLMPGLNSIGEILGNSPERFKDFRALLIANRDLDYRAKLQISGIRSEDAKAIREKFKNDIPLQESVKIFYDTADGVLQYVVNNGLLTKEAADAIRKSNAFYAPMQRVLNGNRNNVGRRGAVKDVIKATTGSELDIKDPLENLIANSTNMIQQVENNNILKALYKQGEETGMTGKIYDVIDPVMVKVGTAKLNTWENELKKQGIDTSKIDLEKTIDLFVPSNKVDANNLITSFIDDNGKRVYLQFHDEILFNSLMNMDKKFMSTVLNINRKLNMPLRYGATMANIGFAIPNVISDTAQAAIFSEAGFIPVVDNIIGIIDILGATNKSARNFFNKVVPGYADRINTMYALYEQAGATSATRMSQYRENTQVLMKNIYGTRNNEVLGIKEKYKPLKTLLDIMTYIPELSEQSTRFRVFERNYSAYKNKGMPELDARIKAALQSRDATQDFGRTGNITREINQLIPFSAARVGSAYTFAEKIKANPKRVINRMAILLAISAAIKAIGYDDEEIEELNQTKKDDNFVFKIGNQVITIKKPQGILRSIINLAEYVQDLFTGHIEEGKEGERLAEWLKKALTDNLPADNPGGYVPNMAAPIIENWANKDFYYNTDIVKSWDLDLPDSQQYYDYTSQLAILLGQIFNYSPAKIDNLISGYFGGLGTQMTNIIDWFSSKLGFSPVEPAMGAEDNAVGKRFVVNVNENSTSVDEIYSKKDELTKKQNGGIITSEEEKELGDIKNGISKISAVNKQIKAIKQDLTMSGDEKANKIRPLQEQKVDIARQALGKEPIYATNTNDLDSLEFYPSRDLLSYNGYELELTEEMKQEYKDLAYNLYKKYEKQGLYNQDYLNKIKSKCKDIAKKQMIQKYRSKLVKND